MLSVPVKKKLIEVALPLEAINKESAREKSIRHGHPSTLHLWWARRPLAACRAVLFASLVDDPSSHPDQFPTEEAQEAERQRLFRIIEELVLWENTNNEKVLQKARNEIMKSTDGNPPPVLDPFCGGGSIPLEAQRLGLEAHGSDLNPVAVLITKALIEIPPTFANQPPVNPESRRQFGAGKGAWRGAQGLAEDVRYYGKWMRDEAEKRIGHLYPKVKLPREHGGGEATVIAWLWARTVKCANPACGARMPLVRSFALSTKKGKEAWAEPVVDRSTKSVRFEVHNRKGDVPDGTSDRSGATCLFCGNHMGKPELRNQSMVHGLESIPFAIVAEGGRGRIYLPFPESQVPSVGRPSAPEIEQPITNDRRWFSPPLYGMPTFADLFTDRQFVALTTFSDLVGEAREGVLADAKAAGMAGDGTGIEAGGAGAQAYADAVATYLAFGVSRHANRGSTICGWDSGYTKITQVFSRQAIPMVWDYAEGNPFSTSTGNFEDGLGWVIKVIENSPAQLMGLVSQRDATSAINTVSEPCICTDPPYYDNIGYADLSDFFYVWLRRSIREFHPAIFTTLLTPKSPELVATPHRFEGDGEAAKEFFEDGLRKVFENVHASAIRDIPTSMFYAFKQSEIQADLAAETSTGWETMLQGLMDSGLMVTGTWPVRTELVTALKSTVNALASSIVLVCRPRPEISGRITRREYLDALRADLPDALRKLQQGAIAPVDLAQAAIGPGMAVYSRYERVLETDGSRMPVRTALGLINQMLDEVLAEQEGELDADTRWAVSWFEQQAFEEGQYGTAETLATARNVSVQGLVDAGILSAKAGKVRLLRTDELPEDWDPRTDERVTAWEITHQLVRALDSGGQGDAAELMHRVGPRVEEARALAYRLYQICERKNWSKPALGYNMLVASWRDVSEQANVQSGGRVEQSSLIDETE